jgi:hypothetical protein
MAQTPKGKAKSARDLRRGLPTREPYDRILIVCEGKKTEPNYFHEIRQEGRISTVHICISPSQLGTQPLQVVNSAVALFHEKKRAFEKVFAVFDRDDHSTYNNAINRAESLSSNGDLINDEGKQATFKAIVSVPCFELWLLLHYANIQSYFHRREILHQLQTHITNYEKGQNGLYKLTQDFLPKATERAENLRNRFSCLPGEEAYTDVDELVGILRSIKSSKR